MPGGGVCSWRGASGESTGEAYTLRKGLKLEVKKGDRRP